MFLETQYLLKNKANSLKTQIDDNDYDNWTRKGLKDDYDKAVREINETKKKKYSTIVSVICIALAIVCFVCSTIAVVPTGYTGIKTTFGKVEDDTVSSGINFILPWQSVVTMDNRTQKGTA